MSTGHPEAIDDLLRRYLDGADTKEGFPNEAT